MFANKNQTQEKKKPNATETQAPQTQQQTQAQPKAPAGGGSVFGFELQLANRFNPDLKAAETDHSHSRSAPHNMNQDVVDLSPLIGAAEHEVVAMDDEQEADVITVDASGVDPSIADKIESTPSTGQRKQVLGAK
eukprot:35860_1